MQEESKKGAWVVSVAVSLTWKNMLQIGVKYLGFSINSMLIIAEDHPNSLRGARQQILSSFAAKVTGKNPEEDPKEVGYLVTKSISE